MRMLVGFLILTLSLPASAELGGRATASTVLRSGAKAVRLASPSSAYSIQQSENDEGVAVREYVSPSGEIFGVTWTGQRMPDLQALFGNANFRIYQDEMQARRPGRAPVRIERSDLVVQSSGHIRAFRGRAYLPQKIPAGVTIGDIR